MKKAGLILIKILVSGIAILYLFKNFEPSLVFKMLKPVDYPAFVASVLLYLFSQYLSAYRLNNLIKIAGVNIPVWQNFKLYLIGMSYNLFLPGGIGGDGYKILVYKNEGASRKMALSSILLERLSGLSAICLVLPLIISFWNIPELQYPWLFLVTPILFFLVYFAFRYIFPSFRILIGKTLLYSLLIQLLQITSILLLAYITGVDHSVEVSGIFLISSIATAIPIFLGGIGAREIVFAWFSEKAGIDISNGIGVALLFSVICIVSSFPGLVLDWGGKFNSFKGKGVPNI